MKVYTPAQSRPLRRSNAQDLPTILKAPDSDFVEAVIMSLAEVLPEVQSLSRLDKIRLIQFLAQELEREGSPIEPGRSYPVWSPDRAFSAAAALLEALAEDKGRS
jgi:hypothetical protein